MDQLIGGRIRDPRHARTWKGLEGGIARLRASYELGCRARGCPSVEGHARGIRRRPSLRTGGLIERDCESTAANALAAANDGPWPNLRSIPSVDDDMVHRHCQNSTIDDRR